jgi:hypothetical protein
MLRFWCSLVELAAFLQLQKCSPEQSFEYLSSLLFSSLLKNPITRQEIPLRNLSGLATKGLTTSN